MHSVYRNSIFILSQTNHARIPMPLEIDLESYLEKYRWKEHAGFYRPAFGKGSIADIPDSILLTQGVKAFNSGVPPIRPDPADHTIFILIDGFGYSSLEYALRMKGNGILSAFLNGSSLIPVTSIFPSTTSTATVTLHTGMDPEEHGIIGYLQYRAEVGAVCNMISMSPVGMWNRSIADNRGFSHIRYHGTLHQRFKGEDIPSYLYMPYSIRNSGLTRITGTGSILRPYHSPAHMVMEIQRDLKSCSGRSFHFAYLSSVDTISHKVGPYTEANAMEIESTFRFISDLISGLKGTRSSILISADHGHTEVDQEKITDVALNRKLRKMMISPMTGDGRSPNFRIREYDSNNFLEAIGKIAMDAEVVASSDMISDGMFGRKGISGISRDAFGDYFLLYHENRAMIDSSITALDPEWNASDMIGMHGGLTYEEMIVPFIHKNVP